MIWKIIGNVMSFMGKCKRDQCIFCAVCVFYYIITDPVSYGFLIPVTVYFRDRGDAFKNH